jgi:hypothetical protein
MFPEGCPCRRRARAARPYEMDCTRRGGFRRGRKTGRKSKTGGGGGGSASSGPFVTQCDGRNDLHRSPLRMPSGFQSSAPSTATATTKLENLIPGPHSAIRRPRRKGSLASVTAFLRAISVPQRQNSNSLCPCHLVQYVCPLAKVPAFIPGIGCPEADGSRGFSGETRWIQPVHDHS